MRGTQNPPTQQAIITMEDMSNEERKKLLTKMKKISTRMKYNSLICDALSRRIEILENQNTELDGEKEKLLDDYKTYRSYLKKQTLSPNKATVKGAKKEFARLEKLKASVLKTFDKVVAKYEPPFDKYKGYAGFKEGPIPSSLRMLSEVKETKKKATSKKAKKASIATPATIPKNEGGEEDVEMAEGKDTKAPENKTANKETDKEKKASCDDDEGEAEDEAEDEAEEESDVEEEASDKGSSAEEEAEEESDE